MLANRKSDIGLNFPRATPLALLPIGFGGGRGEWGEGGGIRVIWADHKNEYHDEIDTEKSSNIYAELVAVTAKICFGG